MIPPDEDLINVMLVILPQLSATHMRLCAIVPAIPQSLSLEGYIKSRCTFLDSANVSMVSENTLIMVNSVSSKM